MKIEVWNVVNVPGFPNQEDHSQYTARPAVVIEDLFDEAVVCPITKQLRQTTNYKHTIEIKKNSPEGRQMGLTFDSIIVLNREIQLKKTRLAGKIGTCPDSIIKKIEALRVLKNTAQNSKL